MQIMKVILCTHLSIPNFVSTKQDRVLSKRKVSGLRLPRRGILTDVEMRSPLAVVQRIESRRFYRRPIASSSLRASKRCEGHGMETTAKEKSLRQIHRD